MTRAGLPEVPRLLTGVRSRLVLVAVVAAVPAITLLGVETARHRSDIRAAQRDEAYHTARLIGSEVGRRFESYRGILNTLNEDLANPAAGAAACSAFATNELREVESIAEVGVVDVLGNLVCAAKGADRDIGFADTDWFWRALATRRLSLGSVVFDPVSHEPEIPIALPHLDAGGKVVSIAYAEVSVRWFESFVSPIGLPEGTSIAVLDHDFRIISLDPPRPDLVNTRVASSLGAALRPVTSTSGYVDVRILPGRHLNGGYASASIGTPPRHLWVVVGISDRAIVHKISVLLWLAIGGVLGSIALVALLAYWLGGALLSRPTRVVLDTVSRIAEGDFGARTGIAGGSSEISTIAAGVDHMAASIELGHAALEQRTALYRGLVDNIPAYVYITSGLGTDRSLTMLGSGPRLGLGEPGDIVSAEDWFRHIYPDDLDRFKEVVDDAMRSGEPLEHVYRALGADGNIIWIRLISHRIGPLEDRVRQGLMIDVTEQWEQAEAIRRLAARAESLAGLARDILQSTALDEIIATTIATIRDLLEPVAVTIRIDGGGVETAVAVAPIGREPHTPDEDAMAGLATGTELLVGDGPSVVLIPVRVDGVTVGSVAIELATRGLDPDRRAVIDDIVDQLALGVHRALLVAQLRTEARLLERRVAERTHDLQAANEELEEFALTVAHDLRAPLRAMAGFSTALIEDYGPQLDADGRNYAQRIVKGAESMHELIEDILAYTRIGRAETEVLPVDLDTVADAVVERLAQAAAERDARIEVRKPLGTVLAARPLLLEVLANYLQNALMFVADGAPEIVLRSETGARSVRISVDDNGIGIPAEQRDRIWKLFERLHPHHEYPGTGLGLAIVAKAADRMNARVGVEPRAEGGSTFWIELPRAE